MSNVLPQGWEEKKLDKIIDIIHGYAFKGKDFSNNETKYILLTPGNFKISGGFKSDKFKYYSEDAFIPNNYVLNKNDLLVTMTDLSKTGDTLGYPLLVPILEDKILLHNQRLGKIKFLTDEIDKYFLYYVFCTYEYRGKVLGSATGTTVRHTAPNRILDFDCKFPSDINEQKRIADILSAFDDKIELNNQMNQTLEDMAITLFADSLLDMKTFTETTLGDLVEIKYGKDHKHLEEGNMPLYGSGGIIRYVNNFLYDKESILIPRKGTLGNLFYIQKPFWTVDTIFYTEINTSKVIPIYLYYALKRFDLANLNVGSAVPSLTKQALNALKLEIPNIAVQKKISDTLTSLHNKILENIEQNQTLKQQRNALLPKLMSGEIRV